MLIGLADPDEERAARLRERLAALGHEPVALDALGSRPAGTVILGWTPAGSLTGLLADLAGRPSTREAAVLIIAQAPPPDLQAAAAVCGAEIIGEDAGDAILATCLRLAGRLQGEASRRRTMETEKARVLVERGALRELAPFEPEGRILTLAAGRYRAQLLLDHSPAVLLLFAIDDLDALRAGAGVDAARDAERATGALLARAPGRLGDMLHARGAGQGWGLWCAGADRQASGAQARQILDLVEARRLPHEFSRAGDALTISIGVAVADRQSVAGEAEARALAALAYATRLGGNRIRWAD